MSENALKNKTATTANQSSASASSYSNLNAEGHPTYYTKGSSEATKIINWNKNQNYTKDYIKKMQRKVGTSDDGSIGTNTINAIRHYQDKNNLSRDGKWGNECATCANLPREYASKKSTSEQSNNEQSQQNNQPATGKKKKGNVDYMTASKVDLQELRDDAIYQGMDVSNVGTAAKYVANNCMSSSAKHQCTRGTSMFMQLASFARGQAKRWYKSSCAAHLFGNGSSNGNIATSVSAEYSEVKEGSEKITGKGNMSQKISNHLSKNGDYVTFQYTTASGSKSQHIVFRVGSTYYSDFKQGTPAGCGNEKSKYWNIKYYNH